MGYAMFGIEDKETAEDVEMDGYKSESVRWSQLSIDPVDDGLSQEVKPVNKKS